MAQPFHIKSFSKAKVRLDFPYLVAVQRDSWKRFWDQDFKELLQELSPIRDYTKKEFELWFLDFKLGEQNFKTDLEAKEKN